MNWALTAAGFGVGIIVGLTGMGGGALMTPVLVIFFGIPPLAAVSSDLVASAVMKPVGSLVHIRHGRVNWSLVRWLCVGSVPAAFAGVLVNKALGNGRSLQNAVQIALGIALLLAVAGLVLRAFARMRDHARRAAARAGIGAPIDGDRSGLAQIQVRPFATALLGAVGGLIVGMTSVGSGSLIIVVLLALYPMLRGGDLVGTDLVQAVPLVASAALGHLIFGDFQFNVTAALLVGSIPECSWARRSRPGRRAASSDARSPWCCLPARSSFCMHRTRNSSRVSRPPRCSGLWPGHGYGIATAFRRWPVIKRVDDRSERDDNVTIADGGVRRR